MNAYVKKTKTGYFLIEDATKVYPISKAAFEYIEHLHEELEAKEEIISKLKTKKDEESNDTA